MRINIIIRNIIRVLIITCLILVGLLAVCMANYSLISAYAMDEVAIDDHKTNEENLMENASVELENIMMLSSGGGRSDNIGIISGTETATLLLSDLTNVQYIPNNNYFLINPRHHDNDVNTNLNIAGVCTTVPLQMLMGYHNYYSDRRLIPTTGNGRTFLNANYGNLAGHPTYPRTTIPTLGQGCFEIGTEDGFFDELYDLNWISGFPGLGQAIGLVKDSGIYFMNDHTPAAVRDNISLTSGFFSKSTAQADIDAGRPIVLGFEPLFSGATNFHVVIAYGYAKLDGVDGFLVHWGWGDSRTQVWVPSSWFGFQMRMSVNHTHSLVDTGNNINDTHRILSCSTCGLTTVDSLYNISGNTITGVRYPLSGSVTIPAAINIYSNTTATFANQTITAIGSIFANQNQLIEVSIPASIASMGENAFSGCTALQKIIVASFNSNYYSQYGILYNKAKTEFLHIPLALNGNVIIPSGITSISDYAFANRTGLLSITVPNSVINIGTNVFEGCNNLTSITAPFVGATANTNLGYLFGTSNHYGQNSFIPSSLKSVEITSDNNIVDYIFQGCQSLTDISIPFGATRIGHGTFIDCISLKNITIPSSVTIIWDSAFSGCSSMESIIIPSSVTDIKNNAFVGCESLKNITVPFVGAKLVESEYGIFHDIFGGTVPSSLTTVTVTGGSIGYGAFYECQNITSITMLNTIPSIESMAFLGCIGLTTITIPSSVTSIGSYAFKNCSKLKTVNILRPKLSGLTTLSVYVFEGCTNLSMILVPDME